MTTEFLAEAAGLLDDNYNFITHSHSTISKNNTPIDINGYSLLYLKTTTKFVEKKVYPSGDYFKGCIDKVTGELIQGIRLYFKSGEEYGGDGIVYYEGWFENGGLRHGYDSVCIYENGNKFVGSFLNDRPFEGVLFTHDYTYNGYFHLNPSTATIDNFHKTYYLPIFDGYGTLMKRNGDIYEGEFKNGNYHGIGKIKCSDDGTLYIGNFQYGKRHGIGIATYFSSLTTQLLCFTQVWYKDRILDDDMLFVQSKVENYDNKNYVMCNKAKNHKNKRDVVENTIQYYTTNNKALMMIFTNDFFCICWNHLLALERTSKNE